MLRTSDPEGLQAVFGCVPLGWSGSASVIRAHMNHCTSNEPMNPFPEWINNLAYSKINWQILLDNNSPLSMITRDQAESHSTLFQEVSSVRDSRLFLAYPSHPTTLWMGENNSGAPLFAMWTRKKFTHREGKNATLLSLGVPSRQVLSTTDAKAIFKNLPTIHQIFFCIFPFLF